MSQINVTVVNTTAQTSLVESGSTVEVVQVTTSRAVELRATETHIQWIRTGDTSWVNLVSLESLTGPPNVLSVGAVAVGPTAAATITGTSPSQVLNLVLPARQPEFRSTATYLQWRLIGDTEWNDLVPVSSIVGPRGPSGGGAKLGTLLALS